MKHAVLFIFLVPLLAGAESPLSGYWEGMIEDPQSPRLMAVTLTAEKDLYKATVDVFGRRGLPMEDIKIQSGSAHFKIQIDTTALVFDGKIGGGVMTGSVFDGEGNTPFYLKQYPPLPQPQNRVEAWSQDLDFAVQRFLKYDRSFSPEARKKFLLSVQDLKSSLKTMNDSQIIVALARAVALSGNAHTRIYLLRNRTELSRLPIRFWWFKDGLYVVRATLENKKLLGCKVTRIGEHNVESVHQQVTKLFAGNESWQKYMSVYFLTSPEILYGMGTIPDVREVSLELVCNRQPVRISLRAMPLQKSDKPVEAWWDLSPVSQVQSAEWTHVLQLKKVPLHLKQPDQYYWFERLPEKDILYFQYNRSTNMPEGENFADFSKRLIAAINEKPPNALVIDLRFNTGGDNGIAREFFRGLAGMEAINKKGKLFAITGRNTFSAGITHAAELKQFTSATFVGEPVGDRLDMWSEGGNLVMPNSRLTLHFANGYHNYSKTNPPGLQPYFQNLDVQELNPDLPVSMTFQDYVSGRDPALEEIMRVSARAR